MLGFVVCYNMLHMRRGGFRWTVFRYIKFQINICTRACTIEPLEITDLTSHLPLHSHGDGLGVPRALVPARRGVLVTFIEDHFTSEECCQRKIVKYQRIMSFGRRESLAIFIDLARVSGTIIRRDEVQDQEDTKQRLNSQCFELSSLILLAIQQYCPQKARSSFGLLHILAPEHQHGNSIVHSFKPVRWQQI